MDLPEAIHAAVSELPKPDQEAALKLFRAMVDAVLAGVPGDKMPESVTDVFYKLTPEERKAAKRFCHKVSQYASAT
jgi:hypothetical protein